MTETAVTRGAQLGSTNAFAGPILMATVLTAAAGSLINAFYEFFFDPQRYAAGPVLARAAFTFAFPIPFILAALLFVGAPTSLILRRFKLDYLIVFGLAGALTGAVVGATVANGLALVHAAFALYGFMSALTFWYFQQRRT